MSSRLSKLLRVSFQSRPSFLSSAKNVRFVAMAAEPQNDKPQCPELPKLSAVEFAQFNRLAEHMDYFV